MLFFLLNRGFLALCGVSKSRTFSMSFFFGAHSRIENGEIRPLKPRNNLIEEEDEESVKSEREISDSSERRPVPQPSKRSSSEKRRKMENGNNENSNGVNTQHSLVGSTKTMDKDELNHIIPPSKKFPQVGD